MQIFRIKLEEKKDFLHDFCRVLSEANEHDDHQGSPQSDNDMENNAPSNHSSMNLSSDR